MKDRIRQLMEAEHLTQNSFAEMIKISPASLSSIFNDRTKPTLNHVEAIRRSFPHINTDWLLYGEGDMFRTSGGVNEEDTSFASSAMGDGDEGVISFGDDYPTPPTGESAHANYSRIAGSTKGGAANLNSGGANQKGGLAQAQKHDITSVKIIDKPQRKILEIRIYFDDQTWETFVPESKS